MRFGRLFAGRDRGGKEPRKRKKADFILGLQGKVSPPGRQFRIDQQGNAEKKGGKRKKREWPRRRHFISCGIVQRNARGRGGRRKPPPARIERKNKHHRPFPALCGIGKS